MKKIITVLILAFCVVNTLQAQEELHILKADSTWLKEIIKFPLSFAQEINFEGYEDLRFAKNWSKPEGKEFFTYAYVWNINLTEKPTLELIETNMKLYYDGLMTSVNKDKDLIVPKTIVAFKEITPKNNSLPSFSGSMNVYDSFFTKKVIKFNVSVETSFCEKDNKYLMLFRVSTLEFENDIWIELNKLKLIDNVCDVKS